MIKMFNGGYDVCCVDVASAGRLVPRSLLTSSVPMLPVSRLSASHPAPLTSDTTRVKDPSTATAIRPHVRPDR